MSRRAKVLIGVGLVVVVGTAVGLAIAQDRETGTEVRMEVVARRDLVATVTASGNIRARRSVDVSSDVQGRIVELLVDEGEEVEAGQLLLRLDPAQLIAARDRAEAQLAQARSQVAQQQANVIKAQRDRDRFRAIWNRDPLLVSRQQVEDAETAYQVALAQLESLEFGVSQAEAAVEEAEDLVSKTTIRAPISGRVTRLNVEEGETVIVGITNSPGSLILTISDLSVIDAVMAVDETDVPLISLGDSAVVELDAFPDRVFPGRVTSIGNSAIRPPASASSAGQTPTIDFEVVITLDDPPPTLRPDLSATADIVVDRRKDALAVPIIALTVRDREDVPPAIAVDSTLPENQRQANTVRDRMDERARIEEGVFVVREGIARFVPVEVGIAGREHFEVLSGLSVGDTVVSGPYQTVRDLEDGEAVRPITDEGSAAPGADAAPEAG